MRRHWIFFAVVLMLAGACAAAGMRSARRHGSAIALLTEAERTWLAQNPDKLVMFYNTDFPPLEYMNDDGKFAGLGADVVEMIEERLGVRFIKRACKDWNKHLAAMESGECAVAPVIVRTAEREKYIFFTTPFAAAPLVIITARGKRGCGSLQELAGKRVAVVAGFSSEQYLRRRMGGTCEIVPVDNVLDGLRAAAFGRVDAFLENISVAAFYISLEGIPNLYVAGDAAYVYEWSVGVSRNYPLLFSAIQKAVNDLTPEELTAIHRRWIALEVPRRLKPETVRLLKLAGFFVILLTAGLLSLTVVLKYQLNRRLAELRASQDNLEKQKAQLEQALRDKETLLRELSHRTKNNMQVIVSMLKLQALKTNHPLVYEILRDTENRIQAMALVHQKLYQSQNLSRIDLRDYLCDLIKLLEASRQSAGNISFRLEIAPLEVPLDIAVPCGLLISELVANVFKHAFPDGRRGEVGLHITRGSDGMLALRFSDDGVGPPAGFDFHAAKTLGLRTMAAIVEQQLQGEIKFAGPPGFTCEARFPENVYIARV